MWEQAISNVTASLYGITTPVRELYDEIHKRGWTVQKVKVKDHAYSATGKNPHGEKVEATGPNEATAVGNLLMKIIRREHIRRSALQHRLGMWGTTFDDQLGEIAQAYAEAPAYDPKAASAWIELAQDSQRRSEVLQGQLQVEIVDEPHPYQTADELREDVKEKQHVFVSRAYASHPIWSLDEMVAFRLVHDVLGHCVGGGDWGWHGENQAFAAHAPLLSVTAQQALFTETLGQSAYAATYRTLGPQKVVFLDDQLEKIQEQENKPGHTPVHPSQSLAPGAIPQFETSTAPPKQGRRHSGPPRDPIPSASLSDPNHGWQSGIDPLPDNAFLWQREPTTGTEPLDLQGGLDNPHAMDPLLAHMDRPLAKQAVANAFRSALLSPRKDPMSGAIHYQHIMGIPADVSDPMVYWEALEQQRQSQNQSRGLPTTPIPFDIELQQFQRWVKSMNPRMDDREVHYTAKRELVHMLQEEEERILAEDPTEELPAEQVEAAAYTNLQKRLKAITKPRVDDKHDFGDSALYHRSYVGPYSAFLASHLRPIAGVSRHADELTDAALHDLASYQGSGHHFRRATLGLGIPGVTPKVTSLAWNTLNPSGSQLAAIDPHLMEALGHDYRSDLNDRDYFKYERELAAGRDAAGYGHVPLGQFSSALRDYKVGGPGFHQDQTPFRVLNPTSHEQVDWLSRNPPERGWSNPYWWDSTQEARDQVGKAWDEHIAINHPKGSIPFQPRTASTPQHIPYFLHPETGEEQLGGPADTCMSLIRSSLGLSAPEVWALNLQAGKRPLPEPVMSDHESPTG